VSREVELELPIFIIRHEVTDPRGEGACLDDDHGYQVYANGV
jgi:hypothetical protein